MEMNEIKLVIWDLDDTFWQGTFSEGNVNLIDDNLRLVNNFLDAGVICSICSKNEEQPVKAFLEENGLLNLFVFVSINWSAKGERVKQIIREMNLRESNVLFLDDNPLNRAEVKACCPNVTVKDVDYLPELRDYFEKARKTDRERKRLKQYRLLENKNRFRADFGTNEEFLRNSNIRVSIHNDCEEEIDRILELINRTNQLNFTKSRLSRLELENLIRDPSIFKGFVKVEDNFGEYGIVGFFAVRENILIQYCFSCRILNMGIEQYVYHYLNKPAVSIVGEVASDLYGVEPDWINQECNTSSAKKSNLGEGKILIKGPCDMSQMFAFIKETKNIITEFVYVNDMGISIESGQHTEHIVQSLTVAENKLNDVIQEVPFGDRAMYSTSLFQDDVDVVIYSLFTDANLGLYENKKSHIRVAFGEYLYDLTNQENWNKYINNEVFTANCRFTLEQLVKFQENYTYLGRIKPEETVSHLEFIRSHISSGAKLILCLGSEIPYLKNVQEAYEDRHLYNKELNRQVREWAASYPNVMLLDVNEFIKDQTAFTNNINHFSREVYYYLSCKVIELVNSGDSRLRNKTDFEMKIEKLLGPVTKLRKIPQKVRILVNRVRQKIRVKNR